MTAPLPARIIARAAGLTAAAIHWPTHLLRQWVGACVPEVDETHPWAEHHAANGWAEADARQHRAHLHVVPRKDTSHA